jgi:hypothetical protein
MIAAMSLREIGFQRANQFSLDQKNASQDEGLLRREKRPPRNDI